jgi:hypothetical protein
VRTRTLLTDRSLADLSSAVTLDVPLPAKGLQNSDKSAHIYAHRGRELIHANPPVPRGEVRYDVVAQRDGGEGL